ncbi:MAG: hypothetical protein U1F77_00345 [Kiritimatiellia bacterium]
MIRRHVLHALSLLLAAGAHAAPPSTLRLERTLGDERFQEDAEIETILPLDDHRVVTLSYGAAVKAWDRDSGKLLAWTRPDWDEGFFDVLPLPGSDRLVLATPSRGHFLLAPRKPAGTPPGHQRGHLLHRLASAGFLADIGGRRSPAVDRPPRRTAPSPSTSSVGGLLRRQTPRRRGEEQVCARNSAPLTWPTASDPRRGGSPTRAGVHHLVASPDGAACTSPSSEEQRGAPGETAWAHLELWHVEVADMNIGRTAWAPDSSWIALTSGDGNLYRVDPKDGSRKLLRRAPRGEQRAAAFHPTGNSCTPAPTADASASSTPPPAAS